MWSWSLRLTRAKATGRSAIRSVASNKVNRPRCNSSMHNVAGELLQNQLTMLSQVELTNALAINSYRRNPATASGRSHAACWPGCIDVETILEDAFEDGVHEHGRHSRLWVEHARARSGSTCNNHSEPCTRHGGPRARPLGGRRGAANTTTEGAFAVSTNGRSADRGGSWECSERHGLRYKHGLCSWEARNVVCRLPRDAGLICQDPFRLWQADSPRVVGMREECRLSTLIAGVMSKVHG